MVLPPHWQISEYCETYTPKRGTRRRLVKAAALLAALFFFNSMTELHTRHFIIIAIAIIASVAVYVDYPLEQLTNIFTILVGILAADKGIAIVNERKPPKPV